MKVECIKEKISAALNKAERVTGKNLTLPILSCIFLEAKNNALLIRATNLDIGIEVSIPVKVIEPGSVAVPGSVVSQFINTVQGDKSVILETNETTLFISSGPSQASIKTSPTDEYPTVPRVTDGKTIKISSEEMVSGLKSVWYSASNSSMKPELASVFIYSDDGDLVFVATDSFRLAEKRVHTKNKIDISGILIPFKNIPDIIRVLDEVKTDVEVSFTKNQISFTSNGIYLMSRIVDGSFPDYKQIIPKEATTETVLLKQDFMQTLKVSNIFSDTFNQVKMKVFPAEKTLEIQTKNATIGENTSRVQAAVNGENIDINFNYKYIIDCFQSIHSDSVSLSFNGMNKPLIIRGVGDRTFTYLVMPMNR